MRHQGRRRLTELADGNPKFQRPERSHPLLDLLGRVPLRHRARRGLARHFSIHSSHLHGVPRWLEGSVRAPAVSVRNGGS